METLGQVLPFALVVALSPIPIVAIVLVLGTPRARVNGPLFAIGWVVGLAAMMAIVLAGLSGVDHPGEGPNAAKVRLALGIVCLVAAGRNWRKRPAPGEEAPIPPWMRHLDELTARKAVGMGVLLGGINPKNLGMVAAASSAISSAGLGTAEVVADAAAFVVVGSLTVAGIVLVHAIFQESSDRALAKLKAFMLANNPVIMTVLFLVFAVVLLAEGASGL
ncbi:MAG: GAP family protein [Acidimicrobiales bacterium]